MLSHLVQDTGFTTEYLKERAAFSQMKDELRRRKRAKWRLRLALVVAGRRRLG